MSAEDITNPNKKRKAEHGEDQPAITPEQSETPELNRVEKPVETMLQGKKPRGAKWRTVVEELTSLRNYHTHNDFEKSVVSGCREPVKLIRKFTLSESGKQAYDDMFTKDFFTRWNKEFQIQNGKYPENNKQYSVGHQFEIDLFAIFSDQVNLSDFLREIFLGDLSHVFPLWPQGVDFSKILVQAGESIYIEITEPVRDVPKKLFQIERTLQLKEYCITEFNTATAAAAVVVNGNIHDVQIVAAALKGAYEQRMASSEGKFAIDIIPTFIIYSPYRNVYCEISDIKKNLSSLDTRLSSLDGKVDTLDGKVDKQFSLLQAQMIWISMEEKELLNECRNRGLSAQLQSSKADLIKLLSEQMSKDQS